MKRLPLLLCLIISAFSAVAQDCPRIFQRGDTLYTDPAPQYQWFKDQNPIPNATNQWYLPPVKGNYTVQISGTTFPFPFTPQTSQKSITGRIIDERYEPIAEATITFGKVSVKSDSKGWFSLKNLTISGENAVVIITKAGFWKNVQRVHFFDQTEAPLTAMLEPLKVTNRFDATKGATISERGFFLTFPPNAIINETGQTYQGTVHLSLKRSFPSEDGFGLRMPGGDFSAIDANGQEKILISYGFMSAEMQGANGEKLRLAKDQEATLEFYIPWEQNKTAPDSMPLWHFDETNGIWKPEGTARKVGPRYVGTVKHFSSWNCDYPRDRATVKGKVVNCHDNPIPYKVVRIGEITRLTDSTGSFVSFVPRGINFYITAGADTVFVDSLDAGETRDVGNIKSNHILGGIGLIDSTGRLTVYGYNVESYSVDSGQTFYPKSEKLSFTENYPTKGIAKDSAGCEVKFGIFTIPEQGDCQMLDLVVLENEPSYGSLENALSSNRIVHRLNLKDQQILNFSLIVETFTCLQWLDLGYNQLRILPESVGQLTNLQTLKLYDNELTNLPESIGQLQYLNLLDLDVNRLTSLPESIGLLISLHDIFINQNQITSLPESIGQLQNLQGLYATTNQMTSLPQSIIQLQNLQHLYVNQNALKSVPENIGQLINLSQLELSFNRLTNLPETFGQLTNLEELYLYQNQLTNLPETFGQLTKMQTLDLGYNQLTSLPPTIANLKDNLKTLNLFGNPISEEEKARIRSWLPNTTISF